MIGVDTFNQGVNLADIYENEHWFALNLSPRIIVIKFKENNRKMIGVDTFNQGEIYDIYNLLKKIDSRYIIRRDSS